MSEVLERRYRSLLRMLPKHYREARGEELLGALMEGADPARRRPEVRETLSLAGLSLRTRFARAGAEGGGSAASRFGEAVRATAFAGSALLACIAMTQLVMIYQHYGTLFLRIRYLAPVEGRPSTPYGPFEVRTSLLMTLRQELPALWLLVFVLLAAGWWSVARVLAVGLFVVAATDVTGRLSAVNEQLLLVAVTTAATLLARRPAMRRIGGRRILVAAGVPAFAAGILAVCTVNLGLWGQYGRQRLGGRLYLELFWGLWVSPDEPREVAAVVALFVAVSVLAFRSAAWPVAVALVALAVFGMFALQPGPYLGSEYPPYFESGGVTEAAAVVGGLLTVAGLAVLRERWVHRSSQPTPAG